MTITLSKDEVLDVIKKHIHSSLAFAPTGRLEVEADYLHSVVVTFTPFKAPKAAEAKPETAAMFRGDWTTFSTRTSPAPIETLDI